MKQQIFEYFVASIIQEYMREHQLTTETYNEEPLCGEQIHKLLFLTCSGSLELVEVFNNFHASPSGHVEQDVVINFHWCEAGKKYTISKGQIKLLREIPSVWLPTEMQELVDRGIATLLKYNPLILHYRTFDLVELSHWYWSWNYYFKNKDKGEYSQFINPEVIKAEMKCYSLPLIDQRIRWRRESANRIEEL